MELTLSAGGRAARFAGEQLNSRLAKVLTSTVFKDSILGNFLGMATDMFEFVDQAKGMPPSEVHAWLREAPALASM